MTPIDIDALEARAKAVAAKTWEDHDGHDGSFTVEDSEGNIIAPFLPEEYAAHIAAFNPAVALALITRLRAAEAEREVFVKLTKAASRIDPKWEVGVDINVE